MTDNQLNKPQSNNPEYCLKCKEMYGHPNFQFMCSLCYKKYKNITSHPTINPKIKENEEQIENLKLNSKEMKVEQNEEKKSIERIPSLKRDLKQSEAATPEEISKQKGKCCLCKKKIGLLGFQCKHCLTQFCKLHRLPQDHSCNVDFITLGRKILKTENPVLNQKKIQQI